jgi:hypothetical protein
MLAAGSEPPVNSGDVLAVDETTLCARRAERMLCDACCADSVIGEVAAHTPLPLDTDQPMTSSSVCPNAPVAGQVKGDVTSVLLAGFASIGVTRNGPSNTAATIAELLPLAVVATLTAVSVPATVARE